jgi:hypothetical protein
MSRRGESVRRAARWRRVVAGSWVIVTVVLFPSAGTVLVSDGVRTLKDSLRG